MDYKPYTIQWTRKRALKEVIYDYLEDLDSSPEQICEDIKDILDKWTNEYSSRADKGRVVKEFLR